LLEFSWSQLTFKIVNNHASFSLQLMYLVIWTTFNSFEA